MKNKLLKKWILRGYHLGLRLTESILGTVKAKELDSLVRFKRILHIASPKSLADKIAWLEYYEITPLKAECTDKWAVREYIRSKGYGEILVPVYGGVYTSADELDVSVLPDAFVIKATHGCKMNYICADKSSMNIHEVKAKIEDWLSTTYGIYSFETHYKVIPHRFYIEKYLGDGDEIVDYKFFCYHGEPSFVEICSQRKSGLKLALYDMSWNRIHCITSKRDHAREFVCPNQFEKMKEIARHLSKDFSFVRVDLYDIHGSVYFSELTFTPAACVLSNFKESFLLSEGEKLTLG